jgi:hypothetical protein
MIIIKKKSGLPLTTEWNILAHQGLANIKLIKHVVSESHITELFKRLNGTQTDTTTTKIRLRQAQLSSNLTYSPLIADMATLTTMSQNANLTIEALKLAAALNIRPHNTLLIHEAQIVGTGQTTRSVIEQHIADSNDSGKSEINASLLRKHYRTLSLKGIFYIDDICIPNTVNGVYNWQ